MSLFGAISGVHSRTKRKFWGTVHFGRGLGAILAGIFVSSVFAYNTMEVLGWASLSFFILAGIAGVWGYNEIGTGSGLLKPQFSDAPGTAALGTLQDLKEHRLLQPGPDRIYCGSFKGQPVYYTGDRHLVTAGPSRSGKDMGLLIPNLLRLNRSVVVMDPKGEAAAVTARYRKTLGPVIVINPFGELTEADQSLKARGLRPLPHLKSSGFNPLAGFDLKDDHSYSRTMSLGEALFKLEGNNPHWHQRARMLGAALIMCAKLKEPELKKTATMDHVMAMLTLPHNSPDENALTLQKLAMQLGKSDYEPMAKLANSFGISGSREVMDVIATALGQTGFLNDPMIMADMKKHPTVKVRGREVPFDFEMLKHQVITVYIILPANLLLKHAVWLRLLVASALDALTRNGPGPIRPVLMLNEVGNLGHLESLNIGMTIAAGMGLTIWTLWQSLSQISTIYGDDGRETFLDQAAVLNTFKVPGLAGAQYLSARTGMRSEVVASLSAAPFGSKTPSKTENVMGFPLLHPLDFQSLKKGELIGWVEPSARPYRLTAPGYWQIPEVAGRADPNPLYVPNG